MKRIKLLLVLVVLFLISSTAFCKDIEIVREGGVRKILTFWKVTYDKVSFTPGGRGENDKLHCLEGGAINCNIKAYSNDKSVGIGLNEYNDAVIYGVCDEIMDLVDESIFDGKETGSVSKKISTKTVDGKEMILAFTAAWNDADVKTGDVKYIIKINEIEI